MKHPPAAKDPRYAQERLARRAGDAVLGSNTQNLSSTAIAKTFPSVATTQRSGLGGWAVWVFPPPPLSSPLASTQETKTSASGEERETAEEGEVFCLATAQPSLRSDTCF